MEMLHSSAPVILVVYRVCRSSRGLRFGLGHPRFLPRHVWNSTRVICSPSSFSCLCSPLHVSAIALLALFLNIAYTALYKISFKLPFPKDPLCFMSLFYNLSRSQ